MDWARKRCSLTVLQSAPPCNSTLRKKLSIMNKMKNIVTENVDVLISEIKMENLTKFYVEIVNSLLNNTKIQTFEDIHKIVRIIYLYSYDPTFMSQLTLALRKRATDSWITSALFAEVYYMMNKQLNPIIRALVKGCRDGPLLLMQYLLECFEEIDTSYIRKRVMSLKDETGENVAAFNAVCSLLSMDLRLEPPKTFIEVISAEEGEFAFYSPPVDTKCEAEERAKGEQDRTFKSLLNLIKSFDSNTDNEAYLDALGASLSGQNDLVNRLLKKRKNPALIPAIARVVYGLKKDRREVIAQFTGDIPTETADLLLIGELYKFNCVKTSDIKNILLFFFDRGDIEKFCCLFGSVARFMLTQKESNQTGRLILDRLKNTSFNSIERIMIDDCLATIHRYTQSHMDLRMFLQWFFREPNFSCHGVFSVMARSRRFMVACLLQPELFESEGMAAKVIKQAGMVDTMLDLYLAALPIYAKRSKQQLFKIAGVLSLLVGEVSRARQQEMLDMVSSSKMERGLMCHILLLLARGCKPSLREAQALKMAKWRIAPEARATLFNFCEKYQIDAEDGLDSFERCMLEMEE